MARITNFDVAGTHQGPYLYMIPSPSCGWQVIGKIQHPMKFCNPTGHVLCGRTQTREGDPYRRVNSDVHNQ